MFFTLILYLLYLSIYKNWENVFSIFGIEKSLNSLKKMPAINKKKTVDKFVIDLTLKLTFWALVVIALVVGVFILFLGLYVF